MIPTLKSLEDVETQEQLVDAIKQHDEAELDKIKTPFFIDLLSLSDSPIQEGRGIREDVDHAIDNVVEALKSGDREKIAEAGDEASAARAAALKASHAASSVADEVEAAIAATIASAIVAGYLANTARLAVSYAAGKTAAFVAAKWIADLLIKHMKDAE